MSIDKDKIKILLVEDAASMRKIEINILKSLGFSQITEAENGSVAIDLLQDIEDFDLIISDWNMPVKGGYDLLIWIRAYKKYKNIPFIMATAQADRAQAQKAENAGVSGFIPKPFTPEDLNQKILEVLGEEKPEDSAAYNSGPVMASSGKVKLRVAHIQITDHLILGVLKDKIDKGEFSPRHFELELHRMAGWNPVEQALDRGQVDAAFVLAPIAQDLFGHGVPIKLTLLAHKNGSIFVRNVAEEYARPFSLFFKDKSFLIPHKLSVHHMLSHLFFDKAGLKASLDKGDDINVNFEVVAPINMPEFLAANTKVCGFMVAEPIGSKSVAAGLTQRQFLSSQIWDNHPCCVLAMRDDFTAPHSDASYEFIEMLVEAGKFVEQDPNASASIAVNFLDPDKKLGLSETVLQKILTEPGGITTGDLFPVINDFETMQRYMHDQMGIGKIINLEKFIDTSFAEFACRDMLINPGRLNSSDEVIKSILDSGISQKISQKPNYKIVVENDMVYFYR